MTPEPFVTPEEVAQHLKITRRQVLKMARKNFLPGHPVSVDSGRRMWRFKLSEVDEAVIARPVRPQTALPTICNRIAAGSPRSRKEQSNG
jgi:excisionase family DNA binding protein